MPAADYQHLLDRDGPPWRCARCIADRRRWDLADLSIDHVVSRHEGGGNELSNLQILCRVCNSAKGTNPDFYWDQAMYFDEMPNLDAMRGATRQLFERMTVGFGDWFSRPRTDIAGVLHTLTWIVAAGKTLAIPTIGWAINRATLERTRGARVPRIDRILVLTKAAGLRDQIAADLIHDIPGYGIARAPSVGVIRDWDDLAGIRGEFGPNIAVSTLQMWFQGTGNEPKFDFARRLGLFSAILIDEPHWGLEQVNRIVEAAHTSVCFGTTGSPIDADGVLLPSMALVTAYGYYDAVQRDQSLKLLTPGLEEHLHTSTIRQADLLDIGSITHTNESPDYAKNVLPKVHVILDAIRHLRQCDDSMIIRGIVQRPAEHRPREAVADLLYPVHLLVKVETRGDGIFLKGWLEDWLARNRDQFPEADGYRVDFVVTEDPDHPEYGAANPLRPTHPWFSSWRKFQRDPAGWNGLPPANACRILLVVGMAREGINNPMCCGTVFAHEIRSHVTTVQLFLGRQLRGLQWTDAQGALHVPPAIADKVHLFNHEAFPRNRDVLEECIDFTLHLTEAVDNLPGLDEIIERLETPPEEPEPGPEPREGPEPDLLTYGQRLRILNELGLNGGDANSLIQDIFARPDQEAQRRAARDWVEEFQRDPQRAARRVRMDIPLRQVEIVTREIAAHEATPEQLREHLRWNNPGLYEAYGTMIGEDGMATAFAEELWRTWRTQFQPGQLPSTTTLEDIRRGLVREIEGHLQELGWGELLTLQHDQHIRVLVARAIKRILGTTDAVNRQSRFEIPEVHQRLLGIDVKRNIQAWVIGRLVREGLLAGLDNAVGQFIPPDDLRDDFEADEWWVPGARAADDEDLPW